MPAKALTFKAGMDDSDFAAGLKRMETGAEKAGAQIGQGLNRGMGGSHGVAGGLRPYGDALNAITGQTGGVMKLNALVHGLGLGLGVALAGVGAGMIAEKIFKDNEAVEALNFQMRKLENSDFSAAASSMQELSSRISEAQKVKEEFEEMAGTKPGQSVSSRFGRSAFNTLADIGDMFQGVPEGGHWVSHADKDKAGAAEAQQVQQAASDAIASKMRDEYGVQTLIIQGSQMEAKLLQEKLKTNERIGALMKEAVATGVDMTSRVKAEQDASAQREEIIKGRTMEARWKSERENSKALIADNDKAMALEAKTAEMRTDQLDKHLTPTQRTNLLQNDLMRQVGFLDPKTMPSLLQQAQGHEAIVNDIGKARDQAAKLSMMTPQQRAAESRAELKMKRAGDAAERHLLRGLSPEQKALYQKEKAAEAKTVSATLDAGSITALAAAVVAGNQLLIAK